MALIDITRTALLQNANRPMTAGELMSYILEHQLWSPPKGGKTPERTLTERLNTDINKGQSLFRRRGGKYQLTKKGLAPDAVRLSDRRKLGYVYVASNVRSLRDERWVKIGSANLAVGNRIYNLNSAMPYNFKVEVLMLTVGTKAVEDLLHEQFRAPGSDEDSKEYVKASPERIAEAMRQLRTLRTYRGAVVWTDWENHADILRILRQSRNDPTKRGRTRRG